MSKQWGRRLVCSCAHICAYTHTHTHHLKMLPIPCHLPLHSYHWAICIVSFQYIFTDWISWWKCSLWKVILMLRCRMGWRCAIRGLETLYCECPQVWNKDSNSSGDICIICWKPVAALLTRHQGAVVIIGFTAWGIAFYWSFCTAPSSISMNSNSHYVKWLLSGQESRFPFW